MKTLKWIAGFFTLFILQANCVYSQTNVPDSLNTSSIDSLHSTDSIQLNTRRDTIQHAYSKDSQRITKYLVLRSKNFFRRSIIYEEHKRLVVITYDGKSMRGRLLIINDSTIALYNSSNGLIDYFPLKNVKLLRDINLATNSMAFLSFLATPIYIVSGLILIADNTFFLNQALGLSLIISGVASAGMGAVYYHGFSLERETFDYHIYFAKGFKLTPKMVKQLYPLN